MKTSQKLLASAVAASTIALAAVAPVANAEVSGSVGVASTYLWRGYDLGSGVPAVSGSIEVSESGFYGGLWGSSGDTTAGTEWDLYAGYAGSVGDFSYGLGFASYVYPTGPGYTDDPDGTGLGDLVEAIINVGYGPVALTVYENLEGSDDYRYVTLGASFGDFSVLAGSHSGDSAESTHLDLSYAYNENLSFIVSKIVSSNDGDLVDGELLEVDGDVKFVVSYSLPLGE